MSTAESKEQKIYKGYLKKIYDHPVYGAGIHDDFVVEDEDLAIILLEDMGFQAQEITPNGIRIAGFEIMDTEESGYEDGLETMLDLNAYLDHVIGYLLDDFGISSPDEATVEQISLALDIIGRISSETANFDYKKHDVAYVSRTFKHELYTGFSNLYKTKHEEGGPMQSLRFRITAETEFKQPDHEPQ